MTYEEEVIDGVLCIRHRLDEPFTPLTSKQLTTRLLRTRKLVCKLRDLSSEANALVVGSLDALTDDSQGENDAVA